MFLAKNNPLPLRNKSKVMVPERVEGVAIIHFQEQQGTAMEKSLILESLLKIDHQNL